MQTSFSATAEAVGSQVYPELSLVPQATGCERYELWQTS
jgi:hypothetical protein